MNEAAAREALLAQEGPEAYLYPDPNRPKPKYLMRWNPRHSWRPLLACLTSFGPVWGALVDQTGAWALTEGNMVAIHPATKLYTKSMVGKPEYNEAVRTEWPPGGRGKRWEGKEGSAFPNWTRSPYEDREGNSLGFFAGHFMLGPEVEGSTPTRPIGQYAFRRPMVTRDQRIMKLYGTLPDTPLRETTSETKSKEPTYLTPRGVALAEGFEDEETAML